MAEILGLAPPRAAASSTTTAAPGAATTASSASNVRSSRFPDFGGGSRGGKVAGSNAHKSWVWGGFGQSAGGAEQRRANDPDVLEGSSSLLPGSGEHESWSSAQKQWGAAEQQTSPGRTTAAVGLSPQDLARSPARMRAAVTTQAKDVPRSSSPYYQLQRGTASHNTSPNGKTYLDAATANLNGNIGEKLDFQTRGRAAGDVGQFGHSQRLSGSGFGPVLGNGVGEDAQADQMRGRGLSNSRNIVPAAELFGAQAVSRSESLPPQGRGSSSPPHSIEHSPQNGSGFPSYTHIPSQNTLGSSSGQLPMTGFPNSIQQPGRYGDLSRETREAEQLLASQFEQMGVDDGSDQAFQIAPPRNRPFHNFSHSQSSISFAQHPQFGDLYQRPPPPGPPPPHLPGAVSPWNPVDDAGGGPMSPSELNENYHQHHQHQHGLNRRGGGAGMASPYFPGTPPSNMENYRTPSSSHGGSQGRNQLPASHIGPLPEKLRQQLLLTQQQQQQQQQQLPQLMRNDMYRHSYQTPSPYRYDPYAAIPMHLPPSYSMAPLPDPRMHPPPQPPSRNGTDMGGLRSVLLEEFRSSSKSNKRYELKDIYHHIVEFSGDQHGSRFIQQKLETANSEEKEQVFNEIRPNSLQLMTDVFGNYVIQKFFEHGSQIQKTVLARMMEGHVLTLSLQMYGCRVVQKALEHVLTSQQSTLISELAGHIPRCIRDQNGNHVIQKALERIPYPHISFIVDAFTNQVASLATHPYGCRVIQRILEHCEPEAQKNILAELHAAAESLIMDQYGNYVVQHVIEHGRKEDRERVVDVVVKGFVAFSRHKFASNVVEKSIAFGSEKQIRAIIDVLTTPAASPQSPPSSAAAAASPPSASPAATTGGSLQSPLPALIRDQYGNYVIQKLLTLVKGPERELLAEQIRAHLGALKRVSYGKQVIAIEKLVFAGGVGGGSTVGPGVAGSPPRGPRGVGAG
ncbi:ARM repeat-containing protein [Ascodesmis nigricans]|uniref:Pumilio homology domain family member 3 n=1 Tax=Ascodesmis nigricans TaxID=341454 RepID=A0A4S2MWF5_9PEZI|nr:ARM repeat-containing protein [Ascodesmis nigricans]